MTTTWDSTIARQGTHWAAWVTVEGWGRRLHDTIATPPDGYRFATLHPGLHGWATASDADPAHSFVPSLQPPEGVIEDAILLGEGRLQLGSWAFEVDDGAVDPQGEDLLHPHGWGDNLITDLLAHDGPAETAPGIWELDDDVAVDAPTISIADVTGLVAGMALWIGAEVVWVTFVDVGAGSIDVERGVYGTTAQAHLTTGHGGDGDLYDRPRYLWGRKVELWGALFDARAGGEGTLLPIADAQRLWTGFIDDWQMVGTTGFRFSCTATLGKLDRRLGRGRVHALVRVPDWQDSDPAQQRMERQERVVLDVDQVRTPGETGEPPYPEDANGLRHFCARLGDQLVELEYDSAHGTWTVVQWGLDETPMEYTSGDWAQLTDVLPVDPEGELGTRYLELGGEPMLNPVDLAWALVCSTGEASYVAGVYTAGSNGDHDLLPAPWGDRAAVPESDLDVDTWRACRDLVASVELRGLRIGWEGDVDLRRFLEEQLLGPLGIYLYQTSDGKIGLGTLSEIYPGDDWPEVTDDDILEDSSGPRVDIQGQLGETLTWQRWSSDFNAEGKALRVVEYRSAAVAARGQAGQEIVREVRGFRDSAALQTAIGRQADLVQRWLESPRARISLALQIGKLEVTLLGGIRLTSSWIPNPFTGRRGLVSQPAVVLRRALDLGGGDPEQPRVASLGVTVVLIPDAERVVWGPAARVTAWDAVNHIATCTATDVCGADSAPGVPATAVEAFQATDLCMVLDQYLAVKSADADWAVTAVKPAGVANKLQFGKNPTSGPVAGDYIVHLHYEDGAAPAAAWTDRMKEHARQASSVTKALPNSDDPVVYGGA